MTIRFEIIKKYLMTSQTKGIRDKIHHLKSFRIPSQIKSDKLINQNATMMREDARFGDF